MGDEQEPVREAHASGTGASNLGSVTASRPPSVDNLAKSLEDGGATPHAMRVAVARTAVEAWRNDQSLDVVAEAQRRLDELVRQRPLRVINATGVLLHTNLGRAPLHAEAARAAYEVAVGYGNVELDLSTGKRGGRHDYLSELLSAATGAHAGTAVNNNAGGLLLTLAALAAPEGAVVSRGELIEIGGSFRLPELMAASGARLIEVGTTNRTRLADYAAISDMAVILKVHPSNYRVEGFAEETTYGELAELAAARRVPFVVDVGSGLLDERTPWLATPPPPWLSDEPGVRQTLEAGADLVLFSGDKLLGGPQAGIIVGRGDLTKRIATHPMMRALRLDGPTLAALTVTLELYGTGRGHEIPFWQMASTTAAELAERLGALVEVVGGDTVRIIEDASLPGAGSVPGERIPSPVLEVAHDVDAIWEALLRARPPILARRQAGAVLVDLRTVDPSDDMLIAERLRSGAAD